MINIPAASATIPNCAITLKLFLIPKALNPSPEKGLRENCPSGIEKYPNIQNSKTITPKGPTSGREINAEGEIELDGIEDDPEIEGSEEEIQETLETPEEIVEDEFEEFDDDDMEEDEDEC